MCTLRVKQRNDGNGLDEDIRLVRRSRLIISEISLFHLSLLEERGTARSETCRMQLWRDSPYLSHRDRSALLGETPSFSNSEFSRQVLKSALHRGGDGHTTSCHFQPPPAAWAQQSGAHGEQQPLCRLDSSRERGARKLLICRARSSEYSRLRFYRRCALSGQQFSRMRAWT